jgi:hypothetical protein
VFQARRRVVDESLHDESTTKGEGKPAMSDDETQPTEKADARTVTIRAEIWHVLLEIAGRQIDPETAEVCWEYAQTFDPYGVYPDLPDEYQQVGRAYFARSPGSDIWVDFGDLPEQTRDALWERHKSKLAFPAGLEEYSIGA